MKHQTIGILVILMIIIGAIYVYSQSYLRETFQGNRHTDLLSKMGRGLYEHQAPFLGYDQVSEKEKIFQKDTRIPRRIFEGNVIPSGLWLHPVPDWYAPHDHKQLGTKKRLTYDMVGWNQPVIDAIISLQKLGE